MIPKRFSVLLSNGFCFFVLPFLSTSDLIVLSTLPLHTRSFSSLFFFQCPWMDVPFV